MEYSTDRDITAQDRETGGTKVQGHVLQETLSWESKANGQAAKALGLLPLAVLA